MPLVERIGEELTRQIDRRKFLKRAAIGIFSFTAAWAGELALFTPSAEAVNFCANQESGCACNISVYCTAYSSSYCSGAACNTNNPPGCSYNYATWTNTGCWCTDVCCGIHGGYYYECCDCTCPDPNNPGHSIHCGCKQIVLTVGCKPPPVRHRVGS